MPIRPEMRHFYAPPFRRTVRQRAITDSCGFCAFCGMPGPDWADTVLVADDGRWFDTMLRVWRDRLGKVAPRPAKWREIRTQLTTAHLDHNPANNGEHNTPALCRGCHLRHDAEHHAVAAHVTRAARKDAARPLLQRYGGER